MAYRICSIPQPDRVILVQGGIAVVAPARRHLRILHNEGAPRRAYYPLTCGME